VYWSVPFPSDDARAGIAQAETAKYPFGQLAAAATTVLVDELQSAVGDGQVALPVISCTPG
jgi:hypothetical protein